LPHQKGPTDVPPEFFIGAGGAGDPKAIYHLSDFKNYLTKTMP